MKLSLVAASLVDLSVHRRFQLVFCRTLSLFQSKRSAARGLYATPRMSRREQPEWQRPDGTDVPQLYLYNSLTRRKELFVPQNGRRVLWYSCGPTVYDASHMGHARSYISFDILRRVLVDYFGYDVFYVMNVTDVDDKIIQRARHGHLLQLFRQRRQDAEQLLADATLALQMYEGKAAAETDADKRVMQSRLLAKLQSAVERIRVATHSGDSNELEKAKQLLLDEAADPLAELLDKRHGSSVDENAIFTDLPRHWENEFHRDMDALNVRPANVLTRVSEYVPEIVRYIERIVERGLAYVAPSGSVYFDVARFDAADGHHYAKLVPEAYGDSAALQEGEGVLSSASGAEKRSDSDFALWKSSRPGEPSWESPWSRGRPGWHIECSVMASALCGSSMDVHTGGFDLRFPHHDNELAQSEAYFGNDTWVRYFLHSGHLTIAGCKMSKSLKNFITIRTALQTHTARQIRLVFLLHSWKDTLDYSDNTVQLAVNFEKFVNEFFLYVRSVLSSAPQGIEFFNKWTPAEIALNDRLSQTREEVHRALCDNVDTRSVLDDLRSLVGAANSYISAAGSSNRQPDRQLLADVARYVTRLLKLFGAIPADGPEIGFPGEQLANGTDVETLLAPFLSVLGRFRERVRQVARQDGITSLLEECDRVRNDDLAELGVRLEDQEGGGSVLKLVGRDAIVKEREERLRQDQLKLLEKERRHVEQLRLEEERQAQRRIPPAEMFRALTDKYSQFDAQGMPTHDAGGKELSKGQLKKLQKLYQAQEKKYQEYLSETKS